jgi:hypothetical protein
MSATTQPDFRAFTVIKRGEARTTSGFRSVRRSPTNRATGST